MQSSRSPFAARPGGPSFLLAAVAASLALAACSRPADVDESAPAEAAAEAAPDAVADAAAPQDASRVTGADPAVAPGVAFTYAFNFRLPDERVSEAQDRHVAACQRLGVAHCRVTGLKYRQEDKGPINANATFLLDPALARGFARDAVDAVTRIDGELIDSFVEGSDVGTGIEASQQTSAQLGGDAARIERRLSQPGLGDRERSELQAQLARLRGDLGEQERLRRQGETQLASTPVQFTYIGQTGVGGFDRSRPFASAWAASTSSFGNAAAFVMLLLGLVLPWALMLGGAVLLWRWAARCLRRAPAVQEG